MYYLFDPPYFLLAMGLFVGITCGLAFEATLKQEVRAWSKDRETRTLATLQGLQLAFPFLGICVGIEMFLVAGMEIFGLPTWLAYAASLSLTLFTGFLVWSQLQSMLVLLERGGSRAIDLDSF